MLRREAEVPAWAEGHNFSGLTAIKENLAVGIQTPLPSAFIVLAVGTILP